MKKGILIVLMMFAGLCFADDKVAEVSVGEDLRIGITKTHTIMDKVRAFYPISDSVYLLEISDLKIAVSKGSEFFAVSGYYSPSENYGKVYYTENVYKMTVKDMKLNKMFFTMDLIEENVEEK